MKCVICQKKAVYVAEGYSLCQDHFKKLDRGYDKSFDEMKKEHKQIIARGGV